jgi:small subunit ribosomal protein S1
VDLDGLDGLLHITDMSWGRIKHPSEMVSVGQELEVQILEVDQDRERVSLGLKQAQPNPWDDIENKFPVGSRLHGKVVNLVPYGAFVEIERGVEGLVHVSELSWTRRIARASDVLAVGQEVDVVVLSINKSEQKIALGVRQTEDNPWDTVQERYPVGSRVKGTVRNFTSYGAFVELEDGIDGMIHISDMSWTRKINHPSELLNKADEVEAVVLEVDPTQNRISLGLKQAQDDPWNSIMARFEVGQIVKGKITKVASFGAFVEIEEGVDGLVHISQISDERVERVKDVLNIGDEIEARIMRIDRAERRIGLSIKAAKMPDDEFMRQRDDMIEGLRRGEDMVDLAGAFDEALGGLAMGSPEEWRPGQSGGGKRRKNEHAEDEDDE